MTALARIIPAETLEPAPAAHGVAVAAFTGGAVLLHVRNPMAPFVGLKRFGGCEGLTVNEAIAKAGWKLRGAHVALRGGEPVRPAELDITPIAPGETVILVTMLRGGGASKVLAAVAMIALVIFAPEIAGFAISAFGGVGSAVAFAGITWLQLATIGVVLAGSMIIQALLPKPKALASPDAGNSSNPAYSLSAQSNTARLLQPIPERFGLLKFKPDLAASASFDFVNSQQEVNEEFCIGMGEYDIHEVGISNNPIWTSDGGYTGTYPEITLLFMPPGTANTLFTDNVVTSNDVQNAEIVGTNEDGWDWSGPYILNPADTLCSRAEVDFSAPGGLFSMDDKGNLKGATVSFEVQVQEIDEVAAPIGDWNSVISTTISQSNRSPIRQTYGADLAPARYRVQFRRTNAKSTSINTADSAAILAMRGFLPNAPARTDSTSIALKALSTKNLNGASAQQFYVLATRKLPIWNPETRTWSAPTATRSIAAAAAYVCRAQNGLRRADNKVDLDKLWSLEAIWTARSDFFDGTFDEAGSAWTVLQQILRVGRAEPLRVGRYITFNRDEPKIIPKAAFSPANMLPGSFNIDYIMFDTNSTDALWIDYVDARNWEPNSVYCALPDSVTDPNDAPHMPIVGITDRDHAWREGMFIVAGNRWRRRFPNFRTELEGRVCFRGDKVVVAHWLPVWGASGSMVDLVEDDAGDIVLLSEPWDHQQQLDDGQKIIRLVTPDGQMFGPVTVELLDDGAITGQAQVRLLQEATVAKGKYAGKQPREWGVWEGEGLSFERPRAMWGTGTLAPTDALMVAMKPEGGNTVTMAVVIDDPRVHYVDGTIPPLDPDDDTPSAPPETNPPAAPNSDDLVIIGLLIREIAQQGGVLTPTHVGVTVQGAPGATGFEAQWKWNDAADFQPVRSGLGRIIEFAAVTGVLKIQVRALGASGFGPWKYQEMSIAGIPPKAGAADDTLTVFEDVTWVAGVTDGQWSWTTDPDATSYAVQAQYDLGDGIWRNAEVTNYDVSPATYGKDRTFFDPSTGSPFAVASHVRLGVKPIYASGTGPIFIYP